MDAVKEYEDHIASLCKLVSRFTGVQDRLRLLVHFAHTHFDVSFVLFRPNFQLNN